MRNKTRIELLRIRVGTLDSYKNLFEDSIRKLQERIYTLENNKKWEIKQQELRLKVIEDSISLIARTLDANHIQKACMHCGQIKQDDDS